MSSTSSDEMHLGGSCGYRLNIDEATVVLCIVKSVMVPKRVSSYFLSGRGDRAW